MPLYNRIANLTVGRSQALGIQLNDFRILFQVRKTPSSEPNFARIEVYGLNANTRSLISKANQSLILDAGYVESSGAETLYSGDVTFVSTSIQKPEVITLFECGDGEESLNNTRVSFSFAPGSTGKQILNRVLGLFKLPLKSNINLIPFKDKVFNNGFSFNGMLKTLVDKITNELDLTWSIQNKEVKVYSDEGPDFSLAIDIGPETGLIGSPEKIRIKKEKQKKGQKEFPGYRVNSLLQPKAEPGGIVLLTSKLVGTKRPHKIYDVSHVGDTEQGKFLSTMQVIE